MVKSTSGKAKICICAEINIERRLKVDITQIGKCRLTETNLAAASDEMWWNIVV